MPSNDDVYEESTKNEHVSKHRKADRTGVEDGLRGSSTCDVMFQEVICTSKV